MLLLVTIGQGLVVQILLFRIDFGRRPCGVALQYCVECDVSKTAPISATFTAIDPGIFIVITGLFSG